MTRRNCALEPFHQEAWWGPVRMVHGPDGEPRWVARDVAEVLGYENEEGSEAMSHIPAAWREICSILTPSGPQHLAVLSERGLYYFLLRSDKPRALYIRAWLADEVLPTIREQGHYFMWGWASMNPNGRRLGILWACGWVRPFLGIWTKFRPE